MSVSYLDITGRVPYAGGRTFGEAGAYERLDGTVYFAIDPGQQANATIVDLEKAPPNDDGRVLFSAGFCLLRPVEPARAGRRLVFEVLNRGTKLMPRFYNHSTRAAATPAEIEAGDGFLFRRGWTLAWCGWQWDVVSSASLLGLTAPQALAGGGRPIQGQVVVQFQTVQSQPDRLLSDRGHQPYAAADVDQTDAELAVRDWPLGERRVLPRTQWCFGRDVSGTPTPDDTRVWLQGGFAAGKVYEVIYRTRVCPVVGAGLLALRDFVSFLRYGGPETANPCAGQIDHTYAFGASQSGRFLRTFLYDGLNLDEAGRQVFDGLHIHIAGGRRGQFNQRFGQPSDASTPNLGHRFPFSYADQVDPITGARDGLLRPQRALGCLPKIIATNSSSEYWRGDACLAHTTVDGNADLAPPAEARVYLFAGTQHSMGGLPLNDVNPADGSHGAHNFNIVDYTPLSRAALMNLDRWVTAGEAPPPSLYPQLADGSEIQPERVAPVFAAIPGACVPPPDRPVNLRRLDFGPEADGGIGTYPPAEGAPYPWLVPAVDGDGNEIAGIRLPDVSVPVATHSGWNPRLAEAGATGLMLNSTGSTLPFPRTAEERLRTGDPRPSIAERYRDRDDYRGQARRAAEALATARYLLTEDVDLTVEAAVNRYDALR